MCRKDISVASVEVFVAKINPHIQDIYEYVTVIFFSLHELCLNVTAFNSISIIGAVQIYLKY